MAEEGEGDNGGSLSVIWKKVTGATGKVVEMLLAVKRVQDELKALQRTVEKQGDELDECREQVAILRGIIGQMQTTYTPEYFRQLTEMAVHGSMRNQHLDHPQQQPPRQIPPPGD